MTNFQKTVVAALGGVAVLYTAAVIAAPAKQKAVEEEANLNINKFEKESLPMITAKVENMADNVFKTIQEDRTKKISHSGGAQQ